MTTAPKRRFWIPWALGAVAGLAVLCTLGHPGITIDEPLDVRPGRTYIATLFRQGAGFFDRETVRTVFADNAEHPPLGRWLLGIASALGEPFEGILGGPDPFSVHAGRLAPMACFAVLVGLVAASAGRRWGDPAAVAAGLSLAFMPRVFAHAHLGALDTFVALTWTAALLAAIRSVASRRPTLMMALAGIAWGLALLTKIHGWLLPPLVVLAAVLHLGPRRATPPLLAWGVVGLIVFAIGWPWLWYDTTSRLSAYFGTGVDRLSLRALYFGSIYADRDVPWHYPWVYFLATIPVGILALAVIGLPVVRRDRGMVVVVAAILFLLVLFSTRVAVYDQERLFLPAFPLAAILAGRGFGRLWGRGNGWAPRIALAIGLALQAIPLVLIHPFGLSHYNLLVGGLGGAERLGLELTYWSDPIDTVLLDELAKVAQPGDHAAIVPTLHGLQPAATMTAGLLEKRITLTEQGGWRSADWLVVSRRTAYWPDGLAEYLAETEAVSLRSRSGVWLAGIWPGPRSARRGEIERSASLD